MVLLIQEDNAVLDSQKVVLEKLGKNATSSIIWFLVLFVHFFVCFKYNYINEYLVNFLHLKNGLKK